MDESGRSDRHRRAATYGRSGPVAASFLLSLIGWLVGTGEVYLILQLIHHPVGWIDACSWKPGPSHSRRGVRHTRCARRAGGGYLLLAPLAGLPPDAALALSLAKRARELLLGVPGLLYLHLSSRVSAPPCKNSGMRAIILAAGRGLRLQQTDDRQLPKCSCNSAA